MREIQRLRRQEQQESEQMTHRKGERSIVFLLLSALSVYAFEIAIFIAFVVLILVKV